MVHLLAATTLASFLLTGQINAASSTECTNPLVRKEWRTLSKDEQLSYLNAVQCLLVAPQKTAKSAIPGVGSRYDDFVGTHTQQTMSIHYTGNFLPWHRWYVAAYETALREECQYAGAQPYWDWTLDVTPSSNFVKSPVFDPVYGFGGNGPYVASRSPAGVPGRTGGGCIQDGPFKNMTIRLGPSSDIRGNPRCLSRDFSPYFAGRYAGKNVTDYVLTQTSFGWFARKVEGGPSFEDSGVHASGHYGVGGDLGIMGDLYVSPGDPIFYMHHSNLDRLWWSWQVKDLTKRLKDISGPLNLMDYSNQSGGNATLALRMTLGGVQWRSGQNVTIQDVMDIRGASTNGTGGVLCYDYDKVY